MCGRFSLTSSQIELFEVFGPVTGSVDDRPRYNIAPTQDVTAIVRGADERRIGRLRWGLVPSWADDPGIGARLINARAETVDRKPSFRRSFRSRRCLVLADGYYEWRREAEHSIPYRIRRPSGRPFAFAGLWDRWRSEDAGTIVSCTIITTEAAPGLRGIHSRMPVILPPAAREPWLDRATRPHRLRRLLRPYPADELDAYRVRTIVNSPANDTPECITPA